VAAFDRDAALKNAEKALKQGRIDAAIAEYVKIVERQPRDWNSANALGDLYVRANHIDKGLAQYVRIADHLAEEGFYSKAAALFKKILKLKPDEEYALLQSADLAAKQGTLADAKQYFQTVAGKRRARGDKKGAAEIEIKLGLLDPDDLNARMGAAKAAADMGDALTAVREFKDLAARYEKLERKDEMLAASQAAYDIDPSDDAIRQRLFAAYMNASAFEKANAVVRGTDELKQIATGLEKAGRLDDVLIVLGRVAELDPADVDVKARLALTYVTRGDLDKARTYLSAETAGSNAALWLTLAEIELRGGRSTEGKEAIVQVLTLDRSQAQAAVVLGCKLAESSSDAGYTCIEAVADAALAEGDYAAAAVALHEFTTRVRSHLVALMRLVEICVDGGLEATMYEAQMALADAYLEANRGLEARIVSEDLVAREPWNKGNIDRFRRALVMLGEGDPDAIIAERLSGESPFLATDKMDLNEGTVFDPPPPPPPAKPLVPPRPPTPPDAPPPAPPAKGKKKKDKHVDFSESGAIELDLDEALDATPASAAAMAGSPRSLDQVFRGLRDEVGRQSSEEGAAEQYALALTYHDMGMVDDAIKALEEAARSPRQRFDAASMLGRVYLERKDVARAIEWLERAAEAPAPTPDSGRALLYDLGQTLEGAGEVSRALAVFVELESESGGYRDVSKRIEKLSKARTRG
jgi:tetratricopeptide (TPR) repeat protein